MAAVGIAIAAMGVGVYMISRQSTPAPYAPATEAPSILSGSGNPVTVLTGGTLDPITAFCNAIRQHEGWYPMSRSYRNDNPGNIKAAPGTYTGQTGTDSGGFAIFATYADGWAALYSLVSQYFNGSNPWGIGPSSTIQDFFSVYAPSSDGNNVSAYASAVADSLSAQLGGTVTPNTQLSALYSA